MSHSNEILIQLASMSKKFLSIKAISTDEAEIFLHGDVGKWDEVNGVLLRYQLEEASRMYKKATLRIHSPGGSVFEGLRIMRCVNDFKKIMQIDTQIDGLAASMGAILSQLGTVRKMDEYGLLMIHTGSIEVEGNATTLREQADLLDKVNDMFAGFLTEKTGKEKQWIVDNWLVDGQDKWFTAEEAKELGLVDEILKSQFMGIAASADKTSLILNTHQQIMQMQELESPQNENQMDIKTLSLSLTKGENANLSESEIQAKINTALSANAIMKAELDIEKKAKTDAVNALETFKATTLDKEITDLVENAIKSSKIIAGDKEVYLAFAKADLTAAKAKIDSLKSYKSVIPDLKDKDADSEKLAAEYDKRHKDGTLEKLSNEKPEYFASLKAAKFPK